jgi:peptidyl-prolyl cis-trans isomerase D
LEKLGKDKAKAKAEAVFKEVQKNPENFAELAKKNSDDPGSAAMGGDLGFFGRGMMVKPFEEATLKLKEGEISEIVESDFGFHIIKLTGIHPAKAKPLAEVKGEIANDLKKIASSRKFAEAAEAFSNMVYEQSDSLQPVAEKFKLTIKQSAWLGRQSDPANGPLANEKVLKALFSEDAIKNKRNTESVEIAANTLVAARIVDHKPAALQSFDSVKGNIESLLRHQEAQTLAKKDGESKLAVVKGGDDKLDWGAAKAVSRMDSRLIPPSAVPAVFKMNTDKLPAYTGVELPGVGYALFKMNQVHAGDQLDNERQQTMLGQLATLSAREDMQLYLASLRSRYKVEINQAVLDSKEK